MQNNFVKYPSLLFCGNLSLSLITHIWSATDQRSKKSDKDKEVKLSIDLSSKNAWENSFLTYVQDVPFHHIGKEEQVIIKTKLTLEHKKTKEASIILLEEPENHLSHSKLNQLIRVIQEKGMGKQILISTHSSFVANKLALKNVILKNRCKPVGRLNDQFFDHTLLPKVKMFPVQNHLGNYHLVSINPTTKSMTMPAEDQHVE